MEHRNMPKNSNPRGTLPETGYVRQSQLIPAILPFSSATLWRKVKAGTFPQPVKLGPRITAWKVKDIRGLIEGRDVSDGESPTWRPEPAAEAHTKRPQARVCSCGNERIDPG
jgi:predicted DNA-binding transcriptional regulator AlpA